MTLASMVILSPVFEPRTLRLTTSGIRRRESASVHCQRWTDSRVRDLPPSTSEGLPQPSVPTLGAPESLLLVLDPSSASTPWLRWWPMRYESGLGSRNRRRTAVNCI